MFFTAEEVYDYDSAKTADLTAFNIYFTSMLEQGIYLLTIYVEAAFMSGAHSDEDIDKTIAASKIAFEKVAQYYNSK